MRRQSASNLNTVPSLGPCEFAPYIEPPPYRPFEPQTAKLFFSNSHTALSDTHSTEIQQVAEVFVCLGVNRRRWRNKTVQKQHSLQVNKCDIHITSFSLNKIVQYYSISSNKFYWYWKSHILSAFTHWRAHYCLLTTVLPHVCSKMMWPLCVCLVWKKYVK